MQPETQCIGGVMRLIVTTGRSDGEKSTTIFVSTFVKPVNRYIIKFGIHSAFHSILVPLVIFYIRPFVHLGINPFFFEIFPNRHFVVLRFLFYKNGINIINNYNLFYIA